MLLPRIPRRTHARERTGMLASRKSFVRVSGQPATVPMSGAVMTRVLNTTSNGEIACFGKKKLRSGVRPSVRR